ncbi:MAG: fibronectin type III domain-containing protein, partial [Thermoguttaceae bacterium]|nr:fibronectin type III domain-containing protein [Thermoguttaceae bacterium]
MRKIRERSLRLESLEDRMLLAVTAGGEEVAAAAIYAPMATEATQLAAPENLTATCPAKYRLSIAWDAVDNASGYTVYYKSSSASSWTARTTATNSYSASGLNANLVYSIKVVANGDGTNYTDSEESETVYALPNSAYTTQVTTLSDIKATADPTGDISFRQAVYFASLTGDTVTFASGLSGTVDLAAYGQITLSSAAKGFTVEGDNRITLTNSGT